jgi:hypothetical protein
MKKNLELNNVEKLQISFKENSTDESVEIYSNKKGK